MGHLAAFRSRQWLDALRPAPARLEGRPHHFDTVHIHYSDITLGNGASFIGVFEALLDDCGHVIPPENFHAPSPSASGAHVWAQAVRLSRQNRCHFMRNTLIIYSAIPFS